MSYVSPISYVLALFNLLCACPVQSPMCLPCSICYVLALFNLLCTCPAQSPMCFPCSISCVLALLNLLCACPVQSPVYLPCSISCVSALPVQSPVFTLFPFVHASGNHWPRPLTPPTTRSYSYSPPQETVHFTSKSPSSCPLVEGKGV